MKQKYSLLFGGMLVLVLGLVGCGVKVEEPQVILEKMTKAMSQIEQMEFAGDFKLTGKSNLALLQGLNDLLVSGSGKINLLDIKDLRYLLNVTISGMSSEGKTEIGAELRSFPDLNYFRLTDIAVPLGLPFSLSADNKWYKIKSNNTDQNNILGATSPLNNDQVVQIRQLIAQSKLFNVVQKFPDETVFGTRTYHWQISFEETALRQLVNSWINITGNQDQVNSQKLSAMLSDYNYEVWINKRDYHIIKATVNGWYDNEENQQVDFLVNISLSGFNTRQDISRPTNNAEEFNLRQLLGLPSGTLSQ
ncbi:hypothetical protein KJ836_01015 [Patescibacteria group bacterium]|nr:hypothetical protein [Patescibacteria group bacterium]